MKFHKIYISIEFCFDTLKIFGSEHCVGATVIKFQLEDRRVLIRFGFGVTNAIRFSSDSLKENDQSKYILLCYFSSLLWSSVDLYNLIHQSNPLMTKANINTHRKISPIKM